MRLVCGVIAALVLLASAPTVLATGAVWTGKRVGVYDYTSAAWRPIVETTVAEFNAMLPPRAPRLLYTAMPEVPCAEISPQLHRGGITVCTAPSLPDAVPGRTDYTVRKGQLSHVRVMLSEASTPAWRDNTVCHEFMHATTGVPDNYDALPDTSCVWGNLDAPGSFDAKYAHKINKKHGEKQAGGKKKGRGRRR